MTRRLSLVVLVLSLSAVVGYAADSLQLRQVKLTASDGHQYDSLGVSVAISGDTVVVGAPQVTVNGKQGQGAAYVFVKPSSGWRNMTQVAKLTASDGAAFDEFGDSVAISGDTIIVGAPNAARNGAFLAGAAYVFSKPANGWTDMTQTAEFTASDEQGEYFGNGVSAQGDTIAISGGDSDGIGHVYVFLKPAGGWVSGHENARLSGTNSGVGGHAIDGNIIVAGSESFQNWKGAAYVFVEPPGGWQDMTETAVLAASDGKPNDDFGSVAISGDTILVGASQLGESGCNCGPGKAYIFVKPAGGWVTGTPYTAELSVGQAPAGFAVGYSVALQGPLALVGSWPAHAGSSHNEGLAFVFRKPQAGWKTTSQPDAIVGPSDPVAYDNFGLSVGLSGTIGVAGADGALVNNSVNGAAYVFGR